MIIYTCGVAWLGYACTEYEECVYWISMYIVSMTLCQGRERRRLLLVVSLHQSDPLSDTFFCDIVVNHEIIKRACLSQQRALEEMLHRLISFFTITRGVILICIFPLS